MSSLFLSMKFYYLSKNKYFINVTQKLLPCLVYDNYLILIEVGVCYRVEELLDLRMWFKAEDFVDKLQLCWNGYNFKAR